MHEAARRRARTPPRSSAAASFALCSSRAWISASGSPSSTASPRFFRQTTPTAWSIASSFARRPAPRWSAASPIGSAASRCTCPLRGANTSRIRGAFGNAASSGSPPCARTQRSYAAVAEPSPTARSARARASARSIPRSESVSRCADCVEHELGEVGRPLAAHGGDGLAHLERVSDRAPERLVHVGQHAHDFALRAPAEREHRLREHLCVGQRLHEGAVTDLDVEHDRVGTGGDLLRHDARCDQRDVVDRRRNVSQRVELLVGGHEIAGLPDDGETDRRAPARRTPPSSARRGSRGSPRACRACRLCAQGRARSSSRTARRTQRRSARPRASSCRPLRRSSACRRRGGRAPLPRSIVSPLRTIASVSANVSALERPWK